MADATINPKNLGSLDTIAQAKDVKPAEGEGNHFQSESREIYTVSALEEAVLVETGKDGKDKKRTTTLWIHCRCRWYWDFFSYKSDCWAWVTDAKDGGREVKVDQVEAHLVHDSNFGKNRKIERNSSRAHAKSRHFGVAVPKPGITAWGCAENSGFGHWCTTEARA